MQGKENSIFPMFSRWSHQIVIMIQLNPIYLIDLFEKDTIILILSNLFILAKHWNKLLSSN